MGERIKDKILYLQLKQKDKEAFMKAYDLYFDDIYRFIYFKISNKEEAEDLTSSVFLKTWEYIQNNSIKNYKTLKSLFYKIARNTVIDHYRKKSNQQNVSLNYGEEEINIADDKQDLHKKIEVDADYEIIRKKMFELKDEYREVITLKYINELSISEIAEVLDKEKGNVRVLIYRAVNALKELAQENKNE